MRAADGTVTHRLMLVGPRTVAVDIDKRRRLVTAGVRLQPWSLRVLFDVTAKDLLGETPGARARRASKR